MKQCKTRASINRMKYYYKNNTQPSYGIACRKLLFVRFSSAAADHHKMTLANTVKRRWCLFDIDILQFNNN